MAYKYFADVKTRVIFSPQGAQPQGLFTDGQLKVITAGLEAGQSIPPHPEGLAIYTFLEGSGAMIVDGERLPVGPGATVITLSGALRSIEADTRLIFIAARISEIPHEF
jgi:quercetin dioxygenase-like cupin family protein